MIVILGKLLKEGRQNLVEQIIHFEYRFLNTTFYSHCCSAAIAMANCEKYDHYNHCHIYHSLIFSFVLSLSLSFSLSLSLTLSACYLNFLCLATDAARAAADIVLTEPGLSTIVEGIVISRCIFVRIRNFVTYRIAATIQLLVFFFIAVYAFKPIDYMPEWRFNPPNGWTVRAATCSKYLLQ